MMNETYKLPLWRIYLDYVGTLTGPLSHKIDLIIDVKYFFFPLLPLTRSDRLIDIFACLRRGPCSCLRHKETDLFKSAHGVEIGRSLWIGGSVYNWHISYNYIFLWIHNCLRMTSNLFYHSTWGLFPYPILLFTIDHH